MKFFCVDCNDNISMIIELINRIDKFVDIEEWEITKFDANPIDTGDLSGVGAITELPSEKLYEFEQRLLDNHIVVLKHKEFLLLLENIRSIYEAEISFVISGQKSEISIMDGDIIEVSGYIETLI